MRKEAYADLYCMTLRCDATHRYKMSALHVACYVHGGCTLSFFCLSCRQQSEFTIPFELGRDLVRAGASSTVVYGPAEVLERPPADVPPIAPLDVGIMERSTLDHFTECARRELLR